MQTAPLNYRSSYYAFKSALISSIGSLARWSPIHLPTSACAATISGLPSASLGLSPSASASSKALASAEKITTSRKRSCPPSALLNAATMRAKWTFSTEAAGFKEHKPTVMPIILVYFQLAPSFSTISIFVPPALFEQVFPQAVPAAFELSGGGKKAYSSQFERTIAVLEADSHTQPLSF